MTFEIKNAWDTVSEIARGSLGWSFGAVADVLTGLRTIAVGGLLVAAAFSFANPASLAFWGYSALATYGASTLLIGALNYVDDTRRGEMRDYFRLTTI